VWARGTLGERNHREDCEDEQDGEGFHGAMILAHQEAKSLSLRLGRCFRKSGRSGHRAW
jgi:hypothetical protein